MSPGDGSRAMTSRFRVATTLARKLEELGVSPADVLRHAGLSTGLFDQEKILVSTEVCFARVVDIARRGTGGPVTPKRLELRGATGNREMYVGHFGCPARFDARENTIVFAKADLDRPFLTHNADLFATIAPQLEAELA